MRNILVLAGILSLSLAAPFSLPGQCAQQLKRGDANADGLVDLSDGVTTLNHLFLGAAEPSCLDAADADDSAELDLSDAVFTFIYLFAGGRPPPAPGPSDCGVDPTGDLLGCQAQPVCGCDGEPEICDGLDNDGDGVIDCGPGFYCQTEVGDCGGAAVCAPRPEVCPLVFKPVCGCDGITYGNACEAAGAGANVKHAGTCERPLCETNDECGKGSYCDKSEGACIGSGFCTLIPEVCPDNIDPVCGCDGVTYFNACEAAARSVSVEYRGECKTQ